MELKRILGILTLGSLWGVLEATLGGALHWVMPFSPYNGAMMFSIAAFIMVEARRSYGKLGVVTAIGFVAASFKLLNLVFFVSPCVFHPIHPMLAIIIEAAAVDIVLAILSKSKLKTYYPLGAVIGSLGALVSAFVLFLPPINRVPALLDPTVFLTYLFISALGCAITVPLAFKLVLPFRSQSAPATDVLIIGGCWMVGILSTVI